MAQQPAAPVIRTTTRVVQVSVVATDKKGTPVDGLTAADFVLKRRREASGNPVLFDGKGRPDQW
jgi:hypothetical protein